MSPGSASVGDDILRWVSETGDGSWSSLNEAIAHCVSSRRIRKLHSWRGTRDMRPWVLASQFSDLGHLDIDWGDGKWSVASPCLAVSPGLGLCAYLAGWRNSALLARLASATENLDVFVFDVPQGDAPKAIFVKGSSLSVLEEFAAGLQVPMIYDPPSQLAGLVHLASGERSLGAPPPPDEKLERFLPDTLRWGRVFDHDTPGIYRFELHGRNAHRLLEGGEWYIVDRAEGQLQVLRGRGDVIRWHPPTRDGRSPRSMSVPWDVTLPPLVTRAAVSASGLLPIVRGHSRVYLNVSHATAEALAGRLGLLLDVSREHILMEG